MILEERGQEKEAGRSEPSKDGQFGGSQSVGVDVFRVGGSVQGRLRGTAVDLWEGVLQELDGGQDLKETEEGTT